MEGTDRSKAQETGRTEGTATGTERKTSGSSSTARKSTGSTARTGNGTGGTVTGTGQSANKTAKQTEKSPQVVAVNVPEVAEKPKKKKAAARTPKKKETISSDMVSSFIVGVSQMAGAKPETKHWEISKAEADKISDPLCRIIEKNENLKKVAENSDSIALVMACVMVVAPRAYMSYQIMKQKKAQKKHNVVKEVKQNDTETGKTTGSNRPDSRKNEPVGTSVPTDLHELFAL